jgi:Holliday junction resolvase-like predicted endonuclease
MKEQKVQAKKIKELEAQGYYVIKLTMTNKNGIPDLLAIPRNSDVIFIEVKAINGKLSKLQEYRLKELQNHGVKVEVFREEKIKSNEKRKGLVQGTRDDATD